MRVSSTYPASIRFKKKKKKKMMEHVPCIHEDKDDYLSNLITHLLFKIPMKIDFTLKYFWYDV